MAADPVDPEHTSPSRVGRVPDRQRDSTPGTHLVRLLGVRSETTITGRRDERIAQVALRQRGRIAYRQLLAIGIPGSSIRWLVAQGRLLRLLQGVFSVGHQAPTELGDETAALLAAGDDAVLTGVSAARLWGLLHPEYGDGLVHLMLPRHRGPALRGVRIHRTRHLPPADVRLHQGLPVLSPARALLEIAEEVTTRRLELAVDRALVDRLVHHQEIAELLARTRGRRAKTLLAPFARQAGAPTLTQSEAEERFLDLIRRAGLPPPQVNARILGYEVDFYWPRERVVVEIDGFRFHSTRRAFEHDRRKDAVLQAAGIATLRVTWHQLEDEPLALAVRVGQRLARG